MAAMPLSCALWFVIHVFKVKEELTKGNLGRLPYSGGRGTLPWVLGWVVDLGARGPQSGRRPRARGRRAFDRAIEQGVPLSSLLRFQPRKQLRKLRCFRT